MTKIETNSPLFDSMHLKDQGYELLRRGLTLEATDTFDKLLLNEKFDAREYLSICFTMGNALRLTGDLTNAQATLAAALSVAENSNDKRMISQLQRALGAVYIERSKFNKELYLKEAYDIMYNPRILRVMDKNSPINAVVSDGLEARATFLFGKRKNAVQMFLMTHRSLKNRHDTYELDNLIWLMRSSVRYRYKYLFRAIQLSARTEPTRLTKAKQAIVLAVGGNWLFNMFV